MRYDSIVILNRIEVRHGMNAYNRPGWPTIPVMFKYPDLAIMVIRVITGVPPEIPSNPGVPPTPGIQIPRLPVVPGTNTEIIPLVPISTSTLAVDYTFPPNEGLLVETYEFELYSNGQPTGIIDTVRVCPGIIEYRQPRTIMATPHKINWAGGTSRIRITFEDVIEEMKPRTITATPRKLGSSGGASRVKVTFEDVIEEFDPRELTVDPTKVDWNAGSTRVQIK
jgi:hypothetical protein